LGAGIYYRYFPFQRSNNKFLQGITTSTSLRWRQNIGSTLSNDELRYANKSSLTSENLKAPNIGIGNTPLIFNIAVGFTLGGKERMKKPKISHTNLQLVIRSQQILDIPYRFTRIPPI